MPIFYVYLQIINRQNNGMAAFLLLKYNGHDACPKQKPFHALMSFFIPTTHIKILPPIKAGWHWRWQGESHGGGDKEMCLAALVAGMRKA